MSGKRSTTELHPALVVSLAVNSSVNTGDKTRWVFGCSGSPVGRDYR